ncbi:methylmalonyl-CoA mutase subunit beta [Bacillus salacetis]|uniref:methylmalonyl-CoA mutase subunit beta n=1 Tax=Bacillus salacetis TaxID=2315464 RepID=UPI003BA22FAE
MKNTSFESVSLDDWKAKAEESLKGKPLEKLYKETYEGITLQPLYTREDVEKESAVNRDRSKREWKIAQRVSAENAADLPEILETVLSRGQDTVAFADPQKGIDGNTLKKVFTMAASKGKPLFHITSMSSAGFEVLRDGLSELSGAYAADPIPSMVNGESSGVQQTWLKNITYLKEHSPKVRTVAVDTSLVNEAGGSAVQELAYAVSAGVSIIEELKEKGWTAEEAAGTLVFNFSIGSSFFVEISKLRAFRSLWKNVTEAYGLNDTNAVISAETSQFTKSRLDPYVNMLRSGNETFAAVLGGADYIHVSPFDQVSGNTSAFSERIARNTQLILSQESHLNKVSDPSGGSYYIESLTNSLARKAWEKFQEIDGSGGIIESLKTGAFQLEIQQVFKKREQDTAVRKQSLIGTNVYADLEETPLKEGQHKSGTQIPGLHSRRLSESFENLRERAARLTEKPRAGLILLGKIKNHKARADFVTGFLAAGGIGVLPSKECLSVDEAIQFAANTNTDYYVICGRDEDYESMAEAILSGLNTNGLMVDIAGKLNGGQMDDLKKAGLNGYIYSGQNVIDKLDTLLSRWEANPDGN